MEKKILIGIIILFIFFGGGYCYLTLKENNKKTEKNYHIGILCGLNYITDLGSYFKEGMTELGYIEGKNVFYDYQKTNFEPLREKQILEKFIEDKVDLIVTFPTEVSIAAKETTSGTEVPVIFAFANIEETGLVESVRQPGKNITGVRYPGPDLAAKRLEILLEMVPDVKRIWIPFQRGYPIVESQMKVLYPIAKNLGLTLIEFPADDANEIQKELDRRSALSDIGMDAVLFLSEPLGVTEDVFLVIGKFAEQYNLPVGGAFISVDGYSSLFGIIVNLESTGKQAAVLADKIFKGTPAGSIPVVSSESFFQMNYKKVQELGLNISEGLLSRADEIIR
ncbi:ABC transporter substrate-binding protein [Candidatus Wolfebacteria bacterium]|nr:ABC transporter substrate-binding protein [Candidatus Wolfebacteria bacterium]